MPTELILYVSVLIDMNLTLGDDSIKWQSFAEQLWLVIYVIGMLDWKTLLISFIFMLCILAVCMCAVGKYIQKWPTV